ncbi:MAG: hypothetical protein ACPGF7_03540 [Pontibacterium sp.]
MRPTHGYCHRLDTLRTGRPYRAGSGLRSGLRHRLSTDLTGQVTPSAASNKTADALKESRARLKQLQAQQRDVKSYHSSRLQIIKSTKALNTQNQTLNESNALLEDQQKRHVIAKANMRNAEKQYRRLTTAMFDGKGGTEEFNHELQRAQISLMANQQTFEKSTNAIKKYKGRIWQARNQIKHLNETQGKARQNMSIYGDKLDKAGISTQKPALKSRDLRREEQRTTQAFKEQKTQLENITRLQSKLTKLRNSGMMVGAHGAAATFAGQQSLRGIFGMLQPGISFGEQMSAVQAITRLDKNDSQFEMLTRWQRSQDSDSVTLAMHKPGHVPGFLFIQPCSPKIPYIRALKRWFIK